MLIKWSCYQKKYIRGRNLCWSEASENKGGTVDLVFHWPCRLMIISAHKFCISWKKYLYDWFKIIWIIFVTLVCYKSCIHKTDNVFLNILYYCSKMRASSFQGGPVTFRSYWPFGLVNILVKFLPLLTVLNSADIDCTLLELYIYGKSFLI